MSNNTVQVTILIAGRPYPLRVSPSEEALMHKIANEINLQLSNFQVQYPGKDMQDCLAMTLIAQAVNQQTQDRQNSPSDKIRTRLKSIEQTLEKML